MTSEQLLLWIAFNLFILTMLALDLGVFHRKAHEVTIRESLLWSVVWVILALLFNLGLYFWRGPRPALEFLTGYLIERALSMDNIFVFLLIFSYFRVSAFYQHKVLFWGILGALVLRALFIATGVTLLERTSWIIYVFGAFLIYTGMRMALGGNRRIDPSRNPVLLALRRFLPVTDMYSGNKFFLKKEGTYYATPLFVVLLVVETTDVIFAVDSIPAILGITRDPFIVYTSNIFAILGLRALYFALEGIMRKFHYLHHGLSVILVFVGTKMVLSDVYEIHVAVALGFVAFVLFFSALASILAPPAQKIRH